MSENILVFRPEAQFPVAKRQKRQCKCSNVGHLYGTGESPPIWIDEATRDCECRVCGARLDAFDYLWHVSTEGNSLDSDLKRMREEKASLKAQVSLLHEQIKELSTARRRLAKSS